MTLAILLSLKTMELLQNQVGTHFRATPLFSMRTVLLMSLQHCEALVLTFDVNGPLVHLEIRCHRQPMFVN